MFVKIENKIPTFIVNVNTIRNNHLQLTALMLSQQPQ